MLVAVLHWRNLCMQILFTAYRPCTAIPRYFSLHLLLCLDPQAGVKKQKGSFRVTYCDDLALAVAVLQKGWRVLHLHRLRVSYVQRQVSGRKPPPNRVQVLRGEKLPLGRRRFSSYKWVVQLYTTYIFSLLNTINQDYNMVQLETYLENAQDFYLCSICFFLQ